MSSTMPSSSKACPTFSLDVTLGYGCDRSVQETLNKACQVPPPTNSTGGAISSSISSISSSTFGSFASSFFGTSNSAATPNRSSANPATTKNTGGNASAPSQRFFVASASQVALSVDEQRHDATTLMAILIPPSLVDECLEKYTSTAKIRASGSCFWIPDASAVQMAQDWLLPSLHPALIRSTQVRGIVRTSIASEENAPAEFILLELLSTNAAAAADDDNDNDNDDDDDSMAVTMHDIVQATNGQALNFDPTAILKVLPLSRVQFQTSVASTATTVTAVTTVTTVATVAATESHGHSKPSTWMKSPPSRTSSQQKQRKPCIPTCAVCLHRIDPVRIGLPTPTNEQLCSKFCPPPNLISWAQELDQSCPKQRFLQPWSAGARCQACQVIHQYWDHHNNNHYEDETGYHSTIFCKECSMHKTLWVCLTCGYVGCGRYSNRHSVQHFQETQHPYSLELATLRVWDYVHEDGFAHRVDLLECPSSPPLTHPWLARGSGSVPASSLHHAASHPPPSSSVTSTVIGSYAANEKSPKKATMIGEEYEALLQSALEDQAQHYEGEISRLRADLTASLIDETSLTPDEQAEMARWQAGLAVLRADIEGASRTLLDRQAQEAGHRATSQRLLHEQQEANALIQRVTEEARQEAHQGKLKVEDLELQVSDLTANLRMRQQFFQSEELNEAQIFGTHETATPNRTSGKRGKKKGRFFRK